MRDFDGYYLVERDGARFIRRDDAERHQVQLDRQDVGALWLDEGESGA